MKTTESSDPPPLPPIWKKWNSRISRLIYRISTKKRPDKVSANKEGAYSRGGGRGGGLIKLAPREYKLRELIPDT